MKNSTAVRKRESRHAIPVTFRMHFGDVDWDDVRIHVEQYRDFIIKRLADKGDWEEVRWLRDTYGLDRVRTIVVESRSVSARTKRFWECFGKAF